MNTIAYATSFLASIFLCGAAQAAVTVIVNEVGGDVVFTSSGTLDLSLWTYGGTDDSDPGVAPSGAIGIGMSSDTDVYLSPVNFNGPANIGPGVSGAGADNGTGDLVTLNWSNPQRFEVVQGYQSGNQLDGMATFSGESLASLELAVGTYIWTWDTATGGSDSFTVNIVPEPTSALLVMASVPLFWRRKRACGQVRASLRNS